jgi:hypothetical protein
VFRQFQRSFGTVETKSSLPDVLKVVTKPRLNNSQELIIELIFSLIMNQRMQADIQ